MNFPLCQIFSVLLMGICAPRCVAISEYGRGGEASIEGTYERTERKRQIGAVRAAALLLRLSVLVRLGKIAHGWRIAFGLLRFGRNLGLRLPAEELRGKKKSKNGPTREREHLDQQLPNWKGGVNGVLKTGDQICSGQEQRNTLGGFREIWNWQRGTGHEYQGQPNELIQDLGFLHGIGDAGDHQSKGAERNNADNDEDDDGHE